MTGLGMAVAGLVWLAWGVYLYRSPNVLERAGQLPLGRSQFFTILLELIALGAFPEGLGFSSLDPHRPWGQASWVCSRSSLAI
jgi:hypothetical protein